MNLKKHSVLLSFSALVFLGACKKTNNFQQNDTLQASTMVSSTFQVKSFSTNHGVIKVLKFNSWRDFDNLAKSLTAQVAAKDDSFVNANAGLSEQAINDLEETLQIDFETPLIQFENTNGFTNSYRKVYNDAMKIWLGKPTLDLNQNPKNKTLFSGGELSLLNQYQQVMIGDTLYHCTNNKYAVIISNYSAGIDFVLDNPNATTLPAQIMGWWFINDPVGCALWKKKGVYPYETSDRKIWTSAGIRSFTVYCKNLAEMESYKKKSNGNWKKYRTDLGLNVAWPSMRDFNCNEYGPAGMGGWNQGNKKEIESNFTLWGPPNSSYRAKNGETIYGTYTYYGLSSYYVLSW